MIEANGGFDAQTKVESLEGQKVGRSKGRKVERWNGSKVPGEGFSELAGWLGCAHASKAAKQAWLVIFAEPAKQRDWLGWFGWLCLAFDGFYNSFILSTLCSPHWGALGQVVSTLNYIRMTMTHMS